MIMRGDFVVCGHFQSDDVKPILEGVTGNDSDLPANWKDIRCRTLFYFVCIERHPHFLGKRRCTADEKQP
jgi:hypothetical protein